LSTGLRLDALPGEGKLIVVEVLHGAAEDVKQLHPEDVITHIDGKCVGVLARALSFSESLANFFNNIKKGKIFTVQVERWGRTTAPGRPVLPATKQRTAKRTLREEGDEAPTACRKTKVVKTELKEAAKCVQSCCFSNGVTSAEGDKIKHEPDCPGNCCARAEPEEPEYTFHVKNLVRSTVEAEVKKNAMVVGTLNGHLVRRTKHMTDFHAKCDELDGELHQISVYFFEHTGKLRDEAKARLGTSCNTGGLLHIKEVEVAPLHRGKDLGLAMIKEVLEVFKGKWSVAIMLPGPLSRPKLSNPPFFSRAEDQNGPNDGVIELSQYFSRLGFKQMSGSQPACDYWYLEASKYTGQIGSKTASRRVDVVQSHPEDTTEVNKKIIDVLRELGGESLSLEPASLAEKERISALESKVSELENRLREIRGELPSLSSSAGMSRAGAMTQAEKEHTLLLKMNELKAQGGDLNQARALHHTVANKWVWQIAPLISLGADVNGTDEFGNTPLHLVFLTGFDATCVNMVALLKLHGANPRLKSEEGRTPLQDARRKVRSMADFRRTLDLQHRPQDQFAEQAVLALLRR